MSDTKRKWEILRLCDGKYSIRANGQELGILPKWTFGKERPESEYYGSAHGIGEREMESLLNQAEDKVHSGGRVHG